MPRTSHIISLIFLIAALIGGVVGAFALRNILMMVFIALILASALYPVVQGAKKLKIPAPVTILSLYLLLFGAISFLISLIAPPLLQQTTQLVTSVSKYLGISEIQLDGIMRFDVDTWVSSFNEYSGFFGQLTGSVQTVLQILLSTFSLLFVFFTLLVMTFHMLMSMDHVALSYAWLMPGAKEEKRRKARELFHAVQQQLGSWVRGQVALMLVVGMMTYAGLLLLGIPYALPLAILAGFLEIVPNLGPTLAAVPAVGVAFLLMNPWIGVFTTLFYILVQQLENNLIVPLIMKEAVDVHPLTTILLMLCGYQLMGVVGAVVVVPLYITIRTVSRHLFPNAGPFMRLGE